MATLCMVLSNCATHANVSGPRPDIFWPNPPEIKRIEFVQAVPKPEDLNIRPGVLKRLANYMVGKSPASIVSSYGIATDAKSRLYTVDTEVGS